MSKSASVYGIAVTPTHVSAVRLSAHDFSVEQHFRRFLPPAILSHDGKRLLDAPTLVPILRELMARVGSPDFSDSVTVSIYAPVLRTQQVPVASHNDILQRLQEQHTDSVIGNESPVIQHSSIRQEDNTLTIAYAVAGEQLLKSYSDAFFEAGLRIEAIDIVPFSVLRAMAASGVLDALVKKIGPNATWGCFGTCGSQTWCTVWQGSRIVYLTSFTTPNTQRVWEERLLDCAQAAGGQSFSLWLVWQEPGVQPPIDPLKLALKAPVRPAMLGPLYGKSSKPPSMPALGAALKSDIVFPAAWDFLSAPPLEHWKSHRSVVPISDYQPVLPKSLLQIAIVLLMLAIVGSLFFWVQGKMTLRALVSKEAQVQTLFSEVTQQNQLYPLLFSWINEKTMPGIQIESLRIEAPSHMALSGKAYDQRLIERYLTLLTTPQAGTPPQIKSLKRSIEPIPGETPAAYRFVFEGSIQPTKSQTGSRS